MSAKDETNDAGDRQAFAESLQRQIDDLKSGRSKKLGSPNLRDFIERKMAEDKDEMVKKPA